ncbi:MAG: bifunctional 4-hydroxy-2-oxoglutarate aldolase/2-dehydro-3-deoxy-phosphogluconate aldolase [Candidatus Omnitrophica bacterium]|nr:bifunctional 4-hydroxy-2-oxoglutarate aldolase/2-dehydro-3-deoxy-phosphogluconate aldolase [Candidatus Omnitrophota bacterium]
MDIKRFKKLPVLGILRGIEEPAVAPLIETIIAAGLETVEITMNTPQAPALIRRAKQAAAGRLAIGAGTVLSLDSMHAALQAGATFIVMPTFVPPVMDYCVKQSIPVFPGALTPQEAYHCWSSGAAMVKIFPASVFGPKYFQALKGPFADMELMAVGGVRTDNVADYMRCGAAAVAIGESIFELKQIRAGNFPAIRQALTQFIQAVPSPGKA